MSSDTSPSRAGVLYLHGFGGSPAGQKATRFAAALAAAGVPLRRPDLNAGADGREDFEHLTLTRALEAARASLFDETVIVGSSMGGYLAALLASQDPRPRALVLMAPAFDLPDRLEPRWGGAEALARWQRDGHLEVDHAHFGEKRRLAYGWAVDARRYPGRPPLSLPTFVLAGQRDDIVPIELVRDVARAAGPHVILREVDDDHSLLHSVDLAIDAALELARAHLELPVAGAPR